MKKLYVILHVLLLQFLLVASLLAQGKVYEGPDDPAGDKSAEREGYMNGNRILLYYQNTTELAKWVTTNQPPLWSKWPNNPDGVRMLDGVGLLIGARVYLENNTEPVTDPDEIANRTDLDTLVYLQTSYREEMDTDPTGTVEWGFYPVFGYFNEATDYPAISNRDETWPTGGWPTATVPKWPGEWNGRFGRGVIYADLETYFVANDAQDLEYLGPEDRVKYYPRPGVLIGDKRADVTIQKGQPWGGVGLRVSQRGFQWSNPQARDAIFWEYSIANISDYDLTEVAFGYWVDNGIGGESDDELGFFDTKIDMAYSWDKDGLGRSNLETGTMGFAYLESPGLAYDGLDNDEDGLLDEKRDDPAPGTIIDGTAGIYNLENFLDTYKLKLEDLKPHWSSDEDQDWQDGHDANGNGTYAINLGTETEPFWSVEPLEDVGDDVGTDGVGPYELNYSGPDADGSECNHQPDYDPDIGCEPNYNATDVTESDMVGLTSFRLFPVPSHSSSYRWFRGDESMWDLIGADSLIIGNLENTSNLIETFASGPFPLFQGREERISMSELHSYDQLAGLNSEQHTAPALYEQKRIVQVIYEKDYRFAQPPKMPTLSATPADGKVILTWDNTADTKTREPLLGNVNDFEGYKLFRATDKFFSDAEIITDGYGVKKFLHPLFQCDIKDSVSGFTNFGMVGGVGYYLGNETGIVHHFIDENVQNGRTYYYALVAYDYGIPELGGGISPSENTIVVNLDEGNNILSYGQNVQIVVPHQPAAGYVPPSLESDENADIIGSGGIKPEIIAEQSLKPGNRYAVTFTIDTVVHVSDTENGIIYTNNGVKIYDVTSGKKLVYQETPAGYSFDNLIMDDSTGIWSFNGSTIYTDVFDGMRLEVNAPYRTARYSYDSDWLVGSADLRFIRTEVETEYFPWDYQVVFTDNDSIYTGITTNKNRIRDEYNARFSGTRATELLLEQKFNFYVENTLFKDENGEPQKLDLVVHDMNKDGVFDPLTERVLVGALDTLGRWAGTVFIIDFQNIEDVSQLPQPNDVYRMTFNRPFWVTDSLYFTVKGAGELDKAMLRTTMDSIKVVPNPYVATNAMEEATVNSALNQPRRIMFTHLPAKCTIKIFTVSGLLVDEIEVDNSVENGTAHWDLLTREGLEIAAGIYIYHVKAEATGDERLGKFAVIK